MPKSLKSVHLESIQHDWREYRNWARTHSHYRHVPGLQVLFERVDKLIAGELARVLKDPQYADPG